MEKGFVRKLWKFPVETQRKQIAERLPARAIYIWSPGTDMLGACLDAFRGQGGTLLIYGDGRVFGSNQADIAAVFDRCEREHIKVLDLAHPELQTHASQMRYAYGQLAIWDRARGSKKHAQARGRKGGQQRGLNMLAKHAERVPAETVRALVGMRGEKITWVRISQATKIPVATLVKYYGADAPKKRKR